MLGAGAPAESFGRSCPSPWMRARVATGCSKKKRFVLGFFYLGLDLQLLLGALVAAPPVPSGGRPRRRSPSSSPPRGPRPRSPVAVLVAARSPSLPPIADLRPCCRPVAVLASGRRPRRPRSPSLPLLVAGRRPRRHRFPANLMAGSSKNSADVTI